MAAVRESAKRRTAMMAFGLAAFMVGLGYAAVPLYDLFCRVTGFGGTTMRVDEAALANPPKVLAQSISVRFDSNVDKDLPWHFKPERPRDRLSIGARDMAVFIARNDSPVPVRGAASFNVTPVAAGKYFMKIQCFCFTEQLLEPGQQMRMPVLFYVDPAIKDDPSARDIEEITLSYTFHRVDEAKTAS
ncbi:MAG: cytochrome c oxidase assembly protein [Sphingopyxis sp.]|nr:cytochrome c oxidase assembly protein [Sphingopyxis sp.]